MGSAALLPLMESLRERGAASGREAERMPDDGGMHVFAPAIVKSKLAMASDVRLRVRVRETISGMRGRRMRRPSEASNQWPQNASERKQ
jgi:hypothetical protein